MRISVTTGGLLDEYLPAGSEGDTAELDVADGATPSDVLEQLGIPLEENYLLSVNGEVVAPSERDRRALAEHDALAILPPLKGG